MHYRRRPVGYRSVYVPPEPPPPDEEEPPTWPYTDSVTTMALPGTSGSYFLLFDITSQLSAGAIADVDSLRFVLDDGTKLGHFRTATNRIFVGGTFQAGLPLKVHYYWGKADQTQPGEGWPSASDTMAAFRLFLVFEGDTPVDYAPDPATFTPTGTVTYEDGYLGRAMVGGDSKYLSTTAAKLRGDARNARNIMVLYHVTQPYGEARLVMWGKWPDNTRSFQLFQKDSGIELYADDNGTSPYTAWTAVAPPEEGRNFAGGSWRANQPLARVQLNDYVIERERDSAASPIPGPLNNAPGPYIVGGTDVAGFSLPGSLEMVIELNDDTDLTADQMEAFFWAWRENQMFFGVDRTPSSIDVLDVTGVGVSTEVQFPQVRVLWLSDNTPISVSGQGSVTYSIGSAPGVHADIRAKLSTPSVVSHGQYVTVYHTSSHLNSTTTSSTVTIGTVTSERNSTTIAAVDTGTPTVPSGDADVVVNSVSSLLSAFAAATSGQIIEITAGDYKAAGNVTFQNKNNFGTPIVVRASTRPWDGYLGNGLVVSGETAFTTGSGGAEFRGLTFKNLDGIVFDGLRVYQGRLVSNLEGAGVDDPPTATQLKSYHVTVNNCRDVTFRYMKFCGYKPESSESEWGPKYPADDVGWRRQSRGVACGQETPWSARVERVKFQHCIVHYYDWGLSVFKFYGSLIENCFITDCATDLMRNDGDNADTIIRNNVFGRLFPQLGDNNDVAHPDCIQCTAKTQTATFRNTLSGNIISVGNAPHGKMQGFFIEQDGFSNGYQEPRENTVENNLFFATSGNTIYFRPSNANIVRNNTIIADFHTGQPPDSNCRIILNANGLSFNNNTVSRNVTDGSDSLGSGDVGTQNVHLVRSTYGQHLVNYSQAGTACRVYNPYKGTLTLSELGRLAPRANSALHPNQTGYDLGCVALFRSLGVLP